MKRIIPKGDKSPTVTVEQLIEHLRTFDMRMPVAYIWEGQVLPVVREKIGVSEQIEKDGEEFVYLDAET